MKTHSDTDEDDFIHHQEDAYSDSEALLRKTKEQIKTQIASNNWSNRFHIFKENNVVKSPSFFKFNKEDNNMTDDENERMSSDEFNKPLSLQQSKLVKTGRQRKRSAARTKGGEFQARRRKKRIYFCCISSEIDVQLLQEKLLAEQAAKVNIDWRYRMYSDVLHLHKPGNPNEASPRAQPAAAAAATATSTEIPFVIDPLVTATNGELESFSPSAYQSLPPHELADDTSSRQVSSSSKMLQMKPPHAAGAGEEGAATTRPEEDLDSRISTAGAQEVFVFDFGAVVFWGFPRGSAQEAALLQLIGSCAARELGDKEQGVGGGGGVGDEKFPSSGEDDMAYVCSGSADEGAGVSVANDVLTLPEDAPAKQRLALSFGIAQSAILAVFEARIDRKILEYKYIPEHMATHGRLQLSEQRLGAMTGAVFVIRHDVNLHSEILDTPDFFWKDGEKFEADYKLIARYLEMQTRTEVLNKRLDMLCELLVVLQQQLENAHGVKLELIVIWLIVVEVVLQAIAIAVDSLPKHCSRL